MSEAWRAANRAHWDEKVGIHLGPRGYDLAMLREGHGRFHAIEEAELVPVAGKRVLHLQCHFGLHSLSWARLGAVKKRTAPATSATPPATKAMFEKVAAVTESCLSPSPVESQTSPGCLQ